MEPKPVEIITVPRTDLVVPDWNPRKFMEEGPLQELTDYIGKGGPVGRILVWKGNGKPPFEVISGQRRLEAYKRLGWERVEVEILDITLTEAKIMANTSNDVVPPFWLDRYEGWESLMKEEFWDQATLAGKLGKSATQTNRAFRTLRVLNAHSRQIIRETLPKPGTKGPQKGPKSTSSISDRNRTDDFRPISEGQDIDPEDSIGPGVFTSWQALPLAAFLSANPKEDEGDLKAQALAEKTLPIMITSGLKGAKAKGLVEAVKGGQQPEDYSLKAVEPPSAPRAPRTAKSQELGLKQQPTMAQPVQTQKPGEEALSGTGVAASSTAPYSGATPRNDGKNLQTPNSSLLTGLSKAFHWVWHSSLPLLKSLFGWGKREAVKSIEKSIKHDIKHWVGMAVKAMGLFILMAVGLHIFYPGSLTRLIAWFMNVQPPQIQTGLNHQDTKASALRPPAEGQALSVPIAAEQGIGAPSTAQTNSPILEKGGQGGFSSSPQALNVPPANTNAKTEIPLNPPLSKGDTSANSPKRLTREQKNAQAALVFARHYFGANYTDLDAWRDFFKQAMDDEDYDPFMDHHFPYHKIHEISDKKLVMSFKPTQPVKLVDSDDSSYSFLVKGVMTTRSYSDDQSGVVSEDPVAAKIVFNEQPNGVYKVGYLKELTPDEVQALLDSLTKAVVDATNDLAKRTVKLPF